MERARLEALIQAELDGDLPAAERAELARALLQDPEARRLHGQYAATDRLLRGVAAAEPPAGLREAILEGTSGLPDSGAAERPAWNAGYRIAAAFAGALLIAGLAYFAGFGRGSDVDLQGSVGAALGGVSLRAEGIAVDTELRRDGEKHRLRIRASAPVACEVLVRFDPAATAFAGSSGAAAASAADGQVVVRLPAGQAEAELEFSGDAPSTLELRAGARVLGEARLPVTGS